LNRFNKVWKNILCYQGKLFYTKTGKEFTYMKEKEDIIVPSRTKWDIPKESFKVAFRIEEEAVNDNKVTKPGSYRGTKIMGPSYVWAILHDPRIYNRKRINYKSIFDSLEEVDRLRNTTFSLEKETVRRIKILREKLKLSDRALFETIFEQKSKLEDISKKISASDEREWKLAEKERKRLRISSRNIELMERIVDRGEYNDRSLLIDKLIENVFNDSQQNKTPENRNYNKLKKPLENLQNDVNELVKHCPNDDDISTLIEKINYNYHLLFKQVLGNNASDNISQIPRKKKMIEEICDTLERKRGDFPYRHKGIEINKELIIATMEILNDATNNKLAIKAKNAIRGEMRDGLDLRLKYELKSDTRRGDIISKELQKINVVEITKVINKETDRFINSVRLLPNWRW